ncbi:hypothetical protein ACT7DA_10890 [Bacillus pacificus]
MNLQQKHDRNFAYAITNKRIMFGQKSLTGEIQICSLRKNK